MRLQEMEEYLISHNYYDDKFVDFTFNGEEYNAQIHYAYFNSHLDEILSKYIDEYDENFMLSEPMNTKNFRSFMNKLVRAMYYKNYSLSYAQDMILEVLTLFNKIINLFDSGSRISHDLSMIEISKAMSENKEIYDLFATNHFTPNMTPEQIRNKRDELLVRMNKLEIPGITPLVRSQAGIKPDQLINMFFGLGMRVKTNEHLNEIYPRFVPERWVDGIRTLDTHYIESNIQRLAAILNSQTMRRSGVHNKEASILAQDTEIIELDCGSVNYIEIPIEDEADLRSIEFKYRFEDGKLIECSTKDKHLIGTTVKLRSVLKCACKEGVCATCFGANAKWSLTNDDYRYDVGFVAARKMNSSISQKVLSVKHSSTPVLVDEIFYVTDMDSGEMIEIHGNDEHNDFFDREFNRLIFRPTDEISFEVYSVLKNKSRKRNKDEDSTYIAYRDGEFNEWDIIRVSTLTLLRDGKEYLIDCNSMFRVKGFPREVTKFWENEDRITVANPVEDISYVIKNSETVMEFKKLQELYKIHSKGLLEQAKKEGYTQEDIREGNVPYLNDSIRYLYDSVKSVIKGKSLTMFECAIRNKISGTDEEIVPDWTTENPEYEINSILVAIGRRPSISAILPRGFIYYRLTDPKFHSVNNLNFSVFDLLFYTDKEEEIKPVEEGE